MVVAAVGTPDRSLLPADVADSKALDPDRRQALARTLRSTDRLVVGTATISVEQIDDPETDMNTLAVRGHARAIEAALDDIDAPEPSTITGLADACDTSTDRFARRVTEACAVTIDLDARHDADSEDELVAAASIVAKVTRDQHIEQLAGEYDHDVGSGYPSDPTTRNFLEQYAAEHGKVPPCARESWSTCADVLEDVEQRGLEEF
jgi:ribonuclease HII